jgi:glutaredoxin 3
MSKVTIYRTAWCPYCQRAEALLLQKQRQLKQLAQQSPQNLPTALEINLIDIEQQPDKRTEMQHLSGRTSVPQIFINQRPIGGYDDMAELERKDQLDPLLFS